MCAATASITATATAIAASTAAPTTPVTASDANSKVNFKKFCGHVYWLTTDALGNIDSIKDIYLIILHMHTLKYTYLLFQCLEITVFIMFL